MSRDEKIQALLSMVRDDCDGTFSVESASLRGWRYTCKPASGEAHATCDCEDQRFKRRANPSYRCKHLLAVRAFIQAQREAAKAAVMTTPETPKPTTKTPTIKASQSAMARHLKRAALAGQEARARYVREPRVSPDTWIERFEARIRLLPSGFFSGQGAVR
jgi:hypothetical protein